jgi:estrone sulfotransferase
VSDFAPFFEIDPHWERTTPSQLIPDIQKRHDQLGRRVFNTHLRGNMLPSQTKNSNSGGAKFIYIVRNPLDACVSFYHHLSHQNEGCYESSLNQFFKDWIDGRIPFGTWTEHILSYAPLIANESVLLITYEEMIFNLKVTVDRIVKYLELDDVVQERHIDKLMPSFSFDAMKNNLTMFQPKSVTWKNGFKFLRKGIIGDSSRELNEEEMLTFEEHLNDMNFTSKLKSMFSGSQSSLDCFETIRRTYDTNL